MLTPVARAHPAATRGRRPACALVLNTPSPRLPSLALAMTTDILSAAIPTPTDADCLDLGALFAPLAREEIEIMLVRMLNKYPDEAGWIVQVRGGAGRECACGGTSSTGGTTVRTPLSRDARLAVHWSHSSCAACPLWCPRPRVNPWTHSKSATRWRRRSTW